MPVTVTSRKPNKGVFSSVKTVRDDRILPVPVRHRRFNYITMFGFVLSPIHPTETYITASLRIIKLFLTVKWRFMCVCFDGYSATMRWCLSARYRGVFSDANSHPMNVTSAGR